MTNCGAISSSNPAPELTKPKQVSLRADFTATVAIDAGVGVPRSFRKFFRKFASPADLPFRKFPRKFASCADFPDACLAVSPTQSRYYADRRNFLELTLENHLFPYNFGSTTTDLWLGDHVEN